MLCNYASGRDTAAVYAITNGRDTAAVYSLTGVTDTAGDGTHQTAAQTVHKLQISHLSNLHCP